MQQIQVIHSEGVCLCTHTRSLHKNSKQTKIRPTGDILLVPTRSNAISREFRVKVRISVRVRIMLWVRVRS